MTAFYDLPKEKRAKLAADIHAGIAAELEKGKKQKTLAWFADGDTYIRKNAYLAMGRIYEAHKKLQPLVIAKLEAFLKEKDHTIRQTAMNAAGEIAKKDFDAVRHFFDEGLFDAHHTVRNAVIGSIKKAGEVNPKPVLQWARQYLRHPDKEIRREICHGIELRGRKYPQDILPLLQALEFDKTARVRNTLVHVLGQIAYKKGCLATVIGHLNNWKNEELVAAALEEIIDVHHRYRNFAAMTQEEARYYIEEHYKPVA